MGEDQQQDQEVALPQADGPLVKVELPDHQVLFAVVKARRQEADTSWWFDLQIHLPKQEELHLMQHCARWLDCPVGWSRPTCHAAPRTLTDIATCTPSRKLNNVASDTTLL
jgi:hypothetical protein